MKSIVVYFSLEGNSKYTAEKIAQEIGAETLRLEALKPYPTKGAGKFIWGGRSAVMGEKRKVKPYSFEADEYDLVIIGTPVWASTYAPPLNTFFSEHDLKGKKTAIFACSTGGDASKCFKKLREKLSETEILGELSLMDPKFKESDENIQKIKEFCSELRG